MTEPRIARKEPYAVELEAGTPYFWCACGHSADQPMCDGNHKNTGLKPVGFKPDESGTHYLCGCKHTKTPPYCDGSHAEL